MSTSTWHADTDLLAAYVAGSLNALEGASVEQHLAACASCRGDIRRVVDVPALERTWLDVRTAVERPRQPWLVALARRLGLPEPTSVLLAATVSLRTAWLTSALVALTFALVAAQLSRDGLLWPFLLVAPLVPVIGVAAAYGPAADPLESLIATAPYGRTRLILVRSLAVLLVCLPVAGLAGLLLLPGPAWVAAAWLGPALALVPVLLALATVTGPRMASAAITVGWSAVVIGSLRPYGPTWAVEGQQQLAYLALATAAVAVLTVRTRKIGATL